MPSLIRIETRSCPRRLGYATSTKKSTGLARHTKYLEYSPPIPALITTMLRYEKIHDVAHMVGHKSVSTTFDYYRYAVDEETEREKTDRAVQYSATGNSPKQQAEYANTPVGPPQRAGGDPVSP